MLVKCSWCEQNFNTDRYGRQTCPHCGAELEVPTPAAQQGVPTPRTVAPGDASGQQPPVGQGGWAGGGAQQPGGWQGQSTGGWGGGAQPQDEHGGGPQGPGSWSGGAQPQGGQGGGMPSPGGWSSGGAQPFGGAGGWAASSGQGSGGPQGPGGWGGAGSGGLPPAGGYPPGGGYPPVGGHPPGGGYPPGGGWPPGGGFGGPGEGLPQDQDAPWERRNELGFLPALVATWKQACLDPKGFYARLKTNDMGEAFLYGWIMASLGYFLGGIWTVLMSVFTGEDVMVAMAQLVGAPIFAAIGLFVGTAIIYVGCLVFGCAGKGFEATFRAVAYAQGPQVLAIIPIVGSLAASVWVAVVAIHGVAAMQRTTNGRAAGAVLLPGILLVLGCVCLLGMVFALVGASLGDF